MLNGLPYHTYLAGIIASVCKYKLFNKLLGDAR